MKWWWQTLATGATDVTLASVGMPLARHAVKEATDVALPRDRRWTSASVGCIASSPEDTVAIDAEWSLSGVHWTRLSAWKRSRVVSGQRPSQWQMPRAKPTNALDADGDDRWNSKLEDMCDRRRHGVCRWCDRRVYCPRSEPNGSFRRGTSINTWWLALGSKAWTFDILVSTLSWAKASPLIPTHLLCIRLRFLSEIEWFKCIHHWFASRGTWGIDLLWFFLLLLVVATT
jgi:hypothetical protein